MVSSSCRVEMESNIVGKLDADILLEILQYLSPVDLSNTALVCTSFLPTTRFLLYRRICFSLTSHRVVRLEKTLRDSKHLRSLIRHLSLKRSYIGPLYDASLDWIALLPEESLQSVHFAFFAHYHLLDPVLQYPAIRTARAVTAGFSNFTTSTRVKEILGFPNLEALSLGFGWFAPVVHCTAPSLKHLTLSMESVSENILDFLTAIARGCPLERLALKIDATLGVEDVAVLTRGLAPLSSTLRRLSITSPYQLARHPFMDNLASSMPNLETLHCGFGSYSPNLLSRLPPALRVLALSWGNSGAAADFITEWDLLFPRPSSFHTPFPAQAYAAEIARLTPISVERIVVVLPEKHLDDCIEMGQVCRTAGIQFQTVSAHVSLLNGFS